ncbi:uncharacterized protein N7496_007531 [Penicillium cataractarum]|uniref:Zn(2)-C6 fungal-type domain-containing protein n=1 Tax=Penicillium cataractarum TaxID=2100454 RepID=A0A9W9V8G0_9EURO|nr:uncharacterized protein N7496_007531 [Penicillium cataractarum]KAJ5371439.1 hypothetical protein N7496_007531 [Penicillium cataractarum]
MQPLVLHPPSLATAQFGQPRFSSGPERLPLNRSWSSNARGYSPRAPLSRQSMSGSPPADEPLVTAGNPKPPLGYSSVSSPAITSAIDVAPSSRVHIPGSTISQPLSSVSEPLPAHITPPRYGQISGPPPPAFGVGSPQTLPGGPPYPLSALESSIAGPAGRSLAQKSTRRTKAHVASACVNCKKKHLGCDPARPCRRCVLAGKASSCVDVTHKKRGRPPLKAEDSSLRSYSNAHVDNPAMTAESQSSTASQRTVMHRATSSRELRPMTDLQGIGEPGPASAAAMRMPRSQPHRWSASVFPLTRPMEQSPPMPGAMGRRPFSSSGPPLYVPPSAPAPPPPAFVPITSGFNPVLKPGTMPPGMDRRFPSYAGPALPPPTSPTQHHSPGVHYLPYSEAPPGTLHQPLSDPRMPHGPREPYLESPVRLPPIHQATASPRPHQPHHAHRLSDPYPASWSSPGREDMSREPRSPAALQRPISSAFSHSSSHHRSSSITGPLDPVPRHLGPVELPSPVTVSHALPAATRTTTTPATEGENSEPRPIKRRKMALDDMVNG